MTLCSNLSKSFLLSCLPFFTPSAMSADNDSPLLFMDNSITLLTGTGFEVPGDNYSVLTLEHASGWSWGDMFAFVDIIDYHSNPIDDSSWYGEFSPRVSLVKLGAFTLGKGSVINDLLISTTYERGEDGIESLLIGAGVDFNVPGFVFFKSNIYARKDTGLGAGFDDMQITLAWLHPFTIGGESFVFDGFIDYVAGWGPQAANFHFVPQIKWDLGAKWGSPGNVFLGTEIDIWTNQFGIPDSPSFNTDQIAINAILRVHF